MCSDIKKICCIGAGYVGGPTMAVFASKCPNINFTVVDIDKDRINKWNHSDLNALPIYEPGLDEIIKNTRNKNLFFSCEVEKNIENADMIFISVNTPTKLSGIGAGQASDLKWIESCTRTVAKFAKGHTIIVEKSTIPVKTAEVIKNLLDSLNTNFSSSNDIKKSFSILSNPEFLAEGSAIRDLEYPDRILIGGEDENSINLLAKLYEKWVPTKKILRTNIWSSELSKLTANAFLAQRISSINSISGLCEETGANVDEVALAIGADTRIGDKFLKSGPGFGGSCFQKDILNLIYLSNFYGLTEVADYWESVIKLNNWQKSRIHKIIVNKLFGTLHNKKIAVLGFAFKANTNDTRESPAIEIVKNLIEENAKVYIYDPKVTKKKIEEDLNKNLENNKLKHNCFFCEKIEETFINADAILITTEWEDFKKINWLKVATLMRKPSWIFDTRSIVNKSDLKKSGINLWKLGYGLNS